MSPAEFAAQLEIFHGASTPALTHIYARLANVPTATGLSLHGSLRGPECLFATTLPATLPFADGGPGDSLLIKLALPDPCFWSEELPALYQVHVELRAATEVLASTTRRFGIRSFGPRQRSFYQEGLRRVIRAAYSSTSGEPDLLAWHDAPLSLCVDRPGDALCEEASRAGVMLIALLSPDILNVANEIRRLSRHAAVAIIAIEAEGFDPTWRAMAPSMVFAQIVTQDDATLLQQHSPHGPQAILAKASAPHDFARVLTETTLPVIAMRRAGNGPIEPARARERCDQLQADLAPYGDFAGYIA